MCVQYRFYSHFKYSSLDEVLKSSFIHLQILLLEMIISAVVTFLFAYIIIVILHSEARILWC
jgi:hypothetical protein